MRECSDTFKDLVDTPGLKAVIETGLGGLSSADRFGPTPPLMPDRSMLLPLGSFPAGASFGYAPRIRVAHCGMFRLRSRSCHPKNWDLELNSPHGRERYFHLKVYLNPHWVLPTCVKNLAYLHLCLTSIDRIYNHQSLWSK